VDQKTIQYYENHALECSRKCESANMSHLDHLLLRHLPDKGARVLELGCGPGREAAFLLRSGYDVTGIDASRGMIDEALRGHPELTGRLSCEAVPLPEDSRMLSESFEAVIAVALFMHIPDQDLFETAFQVKRMLGPHGVLFIGILWHSLVFQLDEGGAVRSIDQVETIIRRDRKAATYKLALLRALCDIAQTEFRKAHWYPDGVAGVPFGLVAEKWLFYYWPLVEPDVVGLSGTVAFPQQRGAERSRPIAFRAPLRELIRQYTARGGLSGFSQDYRNQRLAGSSAALADAALNAIRNTIVAGPVQYAGGEQSIRIGGSGHQLFLR